MSNYNMYIDGDIQLSDYSSIHDYIAILDRNDKLTVSINESSNENLDMICTMLKNDGFNVVSEGGEENGKVFFTAFRNK